ARAPVLSAARGPGCLAQCGNDAPSGATPVRTTGLRPSPPDPRVPPRARGPGRSRRGRVLRRRRSRPRDHAGGRGGRVARREGLARTPPLGTGGGPRGGGGCAGGGGGARG